METYEQKYKEALERARLLKLANPDDEAIQTFVKDSFPELKESEDERIRKKIVSAMSYYRNDGCISEYEFGVCRNWLEKQKAVKTPQWMIDFLNDIRTASINKEGYDDYDGRREYEGKILAIIRWLEGNFIQQKEQKLHLTVSGKEVYKICPRCKSRMIRDDSKVYNSMPPQYGYECPKCGEMEFDTMKYDSPEMEEQKSSEWSEGDELMRKRCIADLGYLTEYEPQYKERYDAQIDWLKSLKDRGNFPKSNTNSPSEWSEEDERKLNRIYEILGYAADDKGFLTSKRIIGDKEAIELQDFLKSLRPQTKQKWSEEDSRILYNVIAYIGYAAGQRGVRDDEFKEANSWLKSLPNGFIVNPNYNEDMVELLVAELQQDAERNGAPQQYSAEIAWLKSLRPQPKSELTLLDKNIIKAAVAFIEQNDRFNYWGGIEKHTVIKALRSLKPHWKPSKEQMTTLLRAEGVVRVHETKELAAAIAQLYEDLKKL